MATELMAFVSSCKEAEWLWDLLINIPLWPKPMPPIFVHSDSQFKLSRAYNQCTIVSPGISDLGTNKSIS